MTCVWLYKQFVERINRINLIFRISFSKGLSHLLKRPRCFKSFKLVQFNSYSINKFYLACCKMPKTCSKISLKLLLDCLRAVMEPHGSYKHLFAESVTHTTDHPKVAMVHKWISPSSLANFHAIPPFFKFRFTYVNLGMLLLMQLQKFCQN